MSDEEVVDEVCSWAKIYSPAIYQFIQTNPEKFSQSIPIWHKNRMDITKWSEIESKCAYLYDSNFTSNLSFESDLCKMAYFVDILTDYLKTYDQNDDSSTWFDKVKSIALKYNYATKPKDYKNNPEAYNGSIVELSAFLRLCLTGEKDSPDIYQISQYLGKNEVFARINKGIDIVAKQI